MAPRKARNSSAFDVKMTVEEREQLADDYCRDIQDALDARASIIGDGGIIDYLDWFYEQGRSAESDRPFPGAADLTSFLITETVDAMRARLVKALFGPKPFCFVEGWGASATNAPYVEAFHDWQAGKTGLKPELAKTIHGALIEDAYILEVRERIETRRVVEQLDVQIVPNAQGGAIFAPSPDGKTVAPQIAYDAEGEPIPAEEGQPAVQIERSSIRTKRMGPEYHAISMKEFVFLPGHAKNDRQVYGYAYRLYDRLPTIQERADDGIYDKAAVAKLSEVSDREMDSSVVGVDHVQAQTRTGTIEKELWQLSIKADLDEDGREEWYVATISLKDRVLLRLKLDTFVMKVGRPRCVPFVLFPRRNSVYGYSYAGNKLLTLAEEHTAVRNVRADRSMLAANAPFKVRQGALWNMDTQPIGPGRSIPVRDMGEVEMLDIPDVPNSTILQERDIFAYKERVGGLSDMASGVQAAEKRTLGENRMVAAGSAVRVDEVIGHLHLAIAAVMELTHAIWIETLEAEPKGLEAPARAIAALQSRGQPLQNGRFTAAQLKGEFAFVPYGSAETADPTVRRGNFNNWMTALANLAKVAPGFGMVLGDPDVQKSILEEGLRVYDVRDTQPFLAAFDKVLTAQQAATGIPGAVGPGMSPGASDPGLGGGDDPMTSLMAMLGGGAPPMEAESVY